MKLIAEAGERNQRTPAFLSRKLVECPKCGRAEYANVEQDRLKFCSLCVLGLCGGKREEAKAADEQGAEKPKAGSLRRSKPARICEQCGESFRRRSNRQRFCEKCQKWAANGRTAGRMRKMRKEKSLVTV